MLGWSGIWILKEEGLKIQILLDPSYSKKNLSPNLLLTKSYRHLPACWGHEVGQYRSIAQTTADAQRSRSLCSQIVTSGRGRRLHRAGRYLRETDTRNIGRAGGQQGSSSPEVLDVVGGHGGVGDAVVDDGVHGDGDRVARQDLKKGRATVKCHAGPHNML